MTKTQIEKRMAKLQNSLDEVNDAINEVSDDTANLASEIQEYIDERTEAWQEGERGRAYTQFVSELESFGDEIDVPEVLPNLYL